MVRPRRWTRFFAFLLVLTGLSACFRSPAPEPLAPLAGASGLLLENLDGVPFNDRLVFSRINGGVTTHKFHDVATLRLRNTSGASITVNSVTLSDATKFKLPNNESKFTIAAGGLYDLKVQFVETAGSRGIRLQTLTLNTSDPNQPTQTVQLAGAFMTQPEGSSEVNLQQIADAFGYKINVGQPLLHNDAALKGDEVRANFWQRADASKPVYVRQLAAFHGCCTSSDSFQISGPGGGSFSHDAAYGQSVLPLKNGSPNPAAMTVNPTGTFEVIAAGYSSNVNNAKNNGFLGLRFYPVRDRSGTLVPGSYLVAQDFVQNGCGAGSANCDYQDNVYLITNVAPVTPNTYRLNVAGPAYTDKAGNLYAVDAGLFTPPDALAEPKAGPSTHAIATTEDDTLYQTYRAFLPNTVQGNRKLTYNLSVPAGVYDVRLHFAELYWDAPGKRVFDVLVEGTTLLKDFDILAQAPKFSAVVKTLPNITVGDGTLSVTLQASADFGALSALEVTPAGGALPSPKVTGTSPVDGATDVFRNTAAAADVELPNLGAGVDAATLSTTSVKLFKTSGGAAVPGTVNTTGGDDAIVYQPSVLLEPSTNYTFQITSAVKDQAGTPFTPYTTKFTTGTQTSLKMDPNVSFAKTSVFSGSAISTLVIGPDGKLYGAGLDGVIHRWQINANGQLQGEQTFRGLVGKAVVGVAFNPNDTKEMYLWTTANEPLYPQPAPDFSGKLYKLRLRGINFFDSDLQLYLTGLPRSAKDHLSNSLAFGPDGLLYMTQGSNSAMGAPDSAWYNRPERLLNAAVLQIDPRRTTGLPINVQTEACDQHCQGTGTTGSYDPYAANAPVKVYATGIRNAYDLVWHSNGKLYVPTNGSAAGGNTPDNPATSKNEALFNVATQDDFLFKVEPGGYYGHPNPKRREYVMNGGNPTASVDPAEVAATGVYAGYPVGTPPETNYRGFTYNFGRNRSPNGVIEYKSNTFGGKLKGKLLVVEYSAGDDILALPLGADGNVAVAGVTQVAVGLSDPLDLIEDTRNGNLYLAELVGGGTSGKISLLSPNVTATNAPPAVNAGGDQNVVYPAAGSATANLDGTVSDDGKPNNTLTTAWRKILGPGTVTFGNAAAVDTTASFSAAGTYVLELSASDGALSNSARVTIAVQVGTSTSQAVTGFVLINADTDQVIRALTAGDTLDYQALGTSNLSVRADTSPATVGSVSFTLDGKPYRVESQAPYALEGDVYRSNPPDYLPISPALALGGHTLQGTPYSASGASGTAGTTLTVSFTVTQGATANTPPKAGFTPSCSNLSCTFTDTSTDDGSVAAWNWNFGDNATATSRNAAHAYSAPGTYSVTLSVTDDKGATSTVSKSVSVAAPASGQAVVTFTLVNADTDRDIGRLSEGMVVDYTALGTSNLSVRADTSPTTVGSVSFVLDGKPYRIESSAPYALEGDVYRSSPTDYLPVSPALAVGSHTLVARPSTEKYGAGTVGAALTVNFTVRQGAPANVAPTAAFSAGCSGLSCTFSDSSRDSDGKVTSWRWAFGDGATSTLQNPAHAYGAPGTYSVSLTVTDNGGATNTLSKNVTVSGPAQAGSAVTRFILVNADTDQDVGPLANGATVDYGVLKTSNITIRADTTPATVGSVSFVLDGKPYRIENYAPYSLAGEVWRGGPTSEYYPVAPPLAPGTHTLSATPSTEKYGGGSAGTSLTVSFTVTQGTASSNLSWSTVASQPYSNDEAQGLTLNGKLYSFGGFDSLKSCCTPTDRAYGYTPATDTWTALAGLPKTNGGANPGGFTHAGTTTDGQDIFFAGGYISNSSGSGQVFGSKEVWRYVVASNTYSRLPDLPVARAAGGLAYLGGKLHYVGGTNQARTQDVGDHYVLELANLTKGWTTAAPLPNPRHHMGVTVADGKLYVVGGQHGHDSALVPQSDVHAYDPATGTWSRLASLTPARNHISSSTFVWQSRVVVAGGQTTHNSYLATVAAYDPVTDRWAELTPLPTARSSGVSGALGDAVYYTTGSGSRRTYKGTS